MLSQPYRFEVARYSSNVTAHFLLLKSHSALKQFQRLTLHDISNISIIIAI